MSARSAGPRSRAASRRSSPARTPTRTPSPTSPTAPPATAVAAPRPGPTARRPTPMTIAGTVPQPTWAFHQPKIGRGLGEVADRCGVALISGVTMPRLQVRHDERRDHQQDRQRDGDELGRAAAGRHAYPPYGVELITQRRCAAVSARRRRALRRPRTPPACVRGDRAGDPVVGQRHAVGSLGDQDRHRRVRTCVGHGGGHLAHRDRVARDDPQQSARCGRGRGSPAPRRGRGSGTRSDRCCPPSARPLRRTRRGRAPNTSPRTSLAEVRHPAEARVHRGDDVVERPSVRDGEAPDRDRRLRLLTHCLSRHSIIFSRILKS